MPARRDWIRLLLAAIVIVSAGTLVAGYVDAERSSERVASSVEKAFLTGDRGAVVGERDGITVVTTDSNAVVSEEGDGPRARAELVAFAPDGSIYYYEDRHTRYWDVDPVEGTRATVEFVYADHLTPEECGAETVCTRNGVERLNLTTGERERVYSRITPGKHSTRWHDVDRIGEDRLLVADIAEDRVYVINESTGLVEWAWDAQAAFRPASGGPYPGDWTHLNDVEYVEIDGRPTVMVSLRNHDQVVFVDFERGLREAWTLGSDGDHDVLFEQHNPDYVPSELGGPALLVADSENGRVVEYQREDGEWVRSWVWEDDRLQWPRDADRLPNGNTLITDSNGDRVVEVNESGAVVWQADLGFPYEAERLGTGEESSGGQSADALGLQSRTPATDGEARSAEDRIAAALPPKLANAIAYLRPRWFGVVEALAGVVLVGAASRWATLEYRWANVSIGLRRPVTVHQGGVDRSNATQDRGEGDGENR